MRTFKAMGTEVTVTGPTLDDAAEGKLAARVAVAFLRNEVRFSRFRPESELSLLNHSTASTVQVSWPMFAALAQARRWHELTGGAFDPTIGAALLALGYDSSFAPGALDRAHASALPALASFHEVALDAATGTVRRPAHLRLDLGGLIKGRTVDEAAALLPDHGALDVGGDGVVRGHGPGGAGWLVEVEDPADEHRTLLTLRLRDVAVATSAPNRRRWRCGALAAHHLIDPRTGLPSTSDLAQVTVVAPSAEQADVLAKATLVLGSAEGRALLARQPDAAAVLVDDAGRVELVGALEVCDP